MARRADPNPSDPADDREPVAEVAVPIADGDHVDELPADLDLENFTVPVTFPNNNRRRIPAVMYALLGSVCVGLGLSRPDSPLLNRGVVIAGILLIVFAVYGFVAGRTLEVDESEALVAANGAVGFPVGHASAQMSWRGLASKPVWRLLVYSAENPPTTRAMVIVDATSGSVVEWFSEENPEEWTER